MIQLAQLQKWKKFQSLPLLWGLPPPPHSLWQDSPVPLACKSVSLLHLHGRSYRVVYHERNIASSRNAYKARKNTIWLTSRGIYFWQSTFYFRTGSFSIEIHKFQLEDEIPSVSDIPLQYITSSLLVIGFWDFFFFLFAQTLITNAS